MSNMVRYNLMAQYHIDPRNDGKFNGIKDSVVNFGANEARSLVYQTNKAV